jgi:hypothetical protein
MKKAFALSGLFLFLFVSVALASGPPVYVNQCTNTECLCNKNAQGIYDLAVGGGGQCFKIQQNQQNPYPIPQILSQSYPSGSPPYGWTIGCVDGHGNLPPNSGNPTNPYPGISTYVVCIQTATAPWNPAAWSPAGVYVNTCKNTGLCYCGPSNIDTGQNFDTALSGGAQCSATPNTTFSFSMPLQFPSNWGVEQGPVGWFSVSMDPKSQDYIDPPQFITVVCMPPGTAPGN